MPLRSPAYAPLDDAQVLQQQPAGELQRIARRLAEVPDFAGQHVEQSIVVAREPVNH
jgi:hypothetical protein